MHKLHLNVELSLYMDLVQVETYSHYHVEYYSSTRLSFIKLKESIVKQIKAAGKKRRQG